MTTTLQRYKAIPELSELNPGYEPGWDFDCLLLMAEPDDKIGSIIMAQSTKDDERGASIVARIVAISPTAFSSQDWAATGLPRPYNEGDLVVTKRYAAGVDVVGADGRTYKMCKDKEIVGRQIPDAWTVSNVVKIA